MKKITNKTILKQGDKIFQPIEFDGVVYWVDEMLEKNKPAILINDFGDKYLVDVIEYYKQDNVFEIKLKKSPFNLCSSSIENLFNIVAQSQPKLDGIPVISLDSYIEKLCPCIGLDFRVEWINGYNSNLNQYTQKDIEKVIELARYSYMSEDKILEQINSISVIEVDEHFNILNYV